MQTSTPLHIGADVAKQEIVVACAEGQFQGPASRQPDWRRSNWRLSGVAG